MRHSSLLRKHSAALIVVDMQEPFLKPIIERERLTANIRLLLQAAQTLKVPVLATVQYANRMGGLVPEVQELLPEGVEPIDKMCFSCCGSEAFMKGLQETGRRQALICGIETHICVNQTAHDLLSAGYEVHVAADAVSSRSEFNTNQAIERMARAGAVITNTESAIYEMLYEAGTPEFKAILSLIAPK